jgi:hypothetical protein
MWIGCLKNCKDKIENINWVTDYVKCLRIYFGHNKAECKKLNIEKQLLKSEKNNEILEEKKHNNRRKDYAS